MSDRKYAGSIKADAVYPKIGGKIDPKTHGLLLSRDAIAELIEPLRAIPQNYKAHITAYRDTLQVTITWV